jgi:outer membrane lipoprotein-sorting protein
MNRQLICSALAVVVICIGMGCRAEDAAPTSAPATAPAPAPATQPAAAAISTLKMLEDRDQTLNDFSGKIRYEVYHPRTDDTEINKGDVYYSKADGVAKFAAHFALGGASGAFQKTDRTLVFDGRWIIDSDANAKVFQKTELVPPGAKVKPLKLGEGPIPIPIGQDTQKVIHDFTVTIEPTDPKMENAADITHLKLIPRSADLAKTYDMKTLEIWVDGKQQLPIKLRRESLDDNATTITIDKVQTNAGVPKVFDLPTPKTTDGWDVRIDTLDKKKAAE